MKRLSFALILLALVMIMIGCSEPTTNNNVIYVDGDVLPDGDIAEMTEDQEETSDDEQENDSGEAMDGDIDDLSEFEEIEEVDRPVVQCDVTGTGKHITIQPVSESIDFGLVDLGESKTEYITICNSGTEIFSVTGIWIRSGDSSEFQVEDGTTPILLASSEGTVVAVTYQPQDYTDDSGTVEILSDSDRTQVDISLTGRANSLGQLEVTPQELQFLSQGGPNVVTLRNIGVSNVTITSLQFVDDSHFSITSIQPGELTGPWSIVPNSSINISITFDGEETAQNTELVIVWHNGESLIESRVILQVGTGNLCAIPNAGSDQIVLPTATVQLDGSLSSDPNDSPEPGELWYQWNFAQKPQGAFRAMIINTAGQAIQGVWTSEARPTFYAELPGLYVVQLRINRQDDSGCDAIDTVNIIAATEEAVHVELSWSVPGNDHDLHVIRHNVEGQTDTPGCFTHSDPSNVNDCHWTNCNTRNKTAFPCPPRGCPGPEDAPDWGVVGSRDDDPTLDVEDIEGTGPEELNLYRPAIGDYFVAVERYSGYSAPELTVRIWIYGVLHSTFDNVSIPEVHQHWNVCWIRVHSATDIEIVPIGVIKDSGDNTTRDCDPTSDVPVDGDVDDVETYLPPGRYQYEHLPIENFTRGEVVEFHPSGDYFVVLESYNIVHIVRWADQSVLRLDVDTPDTESTFWKDMLFDPSGDFAMLVGYRNTSEGQTGVVYRLDDAVWRAWMDGDRSTPVITSYANATAPSAFAAIKQPWDGGLPVILGKGGNSENKTANLYEFDPGAGTITQFASRSGGTVGCDDFAFVNNESGDPGILVVCGEGGAQTMYYTEVDGTSGWQDNPGNINIGNANHCAAHFGGDYGLAVSWSSRSVYRFEAGILNGSNDYPRFPSMGIWGIAFQQQGQRALIFGRAGGDPLKAAVLEYRHDEYWCESLTGECGFTDVSIPDFRANPYNATINGYLYAAAFRPGCDGGVLVGHNGNGSGVAVEFQILNGRQCR